METKYYEIFEEHIGSEQTKDDLREIARALNDGEVVGIPTETVYGLAADATNDEAVAKIFEAKGRPSDNPLIIHIHDMKQMDDFVESLDEKVCDLMEHFWPGPISFVLPLKKGYLSEKAVANLSTVAVRMPAHPVMHEVLKHADTPLAAPSANSSGKPSPTSFQHVKDDLDGKIYAAIESDESSVGIESTVLDCTIYPYRILRPGAVRRDELTSVLQDSVDFYKDMVVETKSPGMKYQHYAPRQPLKIIENWDLSHVNFNKIRDVKIGVIAPESLRDHVDDYVEFVSLCLHEEDYRTAERTLYAALRKLDASDVDVIYIHAFKNNEATKALNNRIYKAAGEKMIED